MTLSFIGLIAHVGIWKFICLFYMTLGHGRCDYYRASLFFFFLKETNQLIGLPAYVCLREIMATGSVTVHATKGSVLGLIVMGVFLRISGALPLTTEK